MAFDPKTVTLADVESLTVDQCRAVVSEWGGPELPKTLKRPDAIAYATLALRAAGRPADAIPAAEAPADVREPVIDALGDQLEPKPSDTLPTPSRWQQLVEMGNFLAAADLCPAQLKKKPADVTLVLLAGHDLGIPSTMALQRIIVLDGKLSMAAELMAALIRRDGHTIHVDPASSPREMILTGKRADTGEEFTASYSIDDAVAAKLCTIDDDGNVRARSQSNNPKPWEKHTGDMLWARALSRLARRAFSDCLLGVSHTPEELGEIDYVEEAQPRSNATGDAPMSPAEQRSNISERLSALDPDLVDEVRAEWKRRNLPTLAKLHGAATGQVIRLVVAAEYKQAARETDATGDVDEAETVPTCGICSLASDEATVVAQGADGGWRCVDVDACMGRVSDAARLAAASDAPFAGPAVPETAAETVVACRETPPGSCTAPAVEDGYCEAHQPM